MPQIFVKEAKNAMTPVVRREDAQAGREDARVSRGRRLRARRRRSAAGRRRCVKDDALELLATEDGDPLLAFWPIGLGRTAVFASDVKDRWATDWVKWRGYGPFFCVARARASSGSARPAAASRSTPRTGARQRAPAHGDASRRAMRTGNYLRSLKPVVTVQAGDGTHGETDGAPGRARPLRGARHRRRARSR